MRPAPERQRSLAGLFLVAALALSAMACTARAPRNIDDSCEIFDERRGWYRAAKKSSKRWGVPIHVQLAIIHQESRFRARAKPPRRKILWIFPGPRPSSAYGYTQALKGTWKEYVEDTGNCRADRDDFGDAADFIGWYAARSARATGISKSDAYRIYLAFHEGNAGFRRRTYRNKPWLVTVAKQVQARANRYARQLATCEGRFKRRWWTLWLF